LSLEQPASIRKWSQNRHQRCLQATQWSNQFKRRRICHLKVVLFESIDLWIDRWASSKGAALAFYILFSMTPILLLIIAITSYVFGA